MLVYISGTLPGYPGTLEIPSKLRCSLQTVGIWNPKPPRFNCDNKSMPQVAGGSGIFHLDKGKVDLRSSCEFTVNRYCI